MAKNICFYFQVHQPWRLGKRSLLRPSHDAQYFDGISPHTNREVFEKVAKKSYLPTTELLLRLVKKHKDFAASFSLSGVFLDQCQQFGSTGTAVLENFKQLAKSSHIELLGETYFHSLAFLFSKQEFVDQVAQHHAAMQKIFGKKPQVFRHTELIYNNELASCIHALGYRGIIAEGWPAGMTDDQNPNWVREANLIPLPADDKKIMDAHAFKKWSGVKTKTSDRLPVLTKNFQLSDDIAFRFGDKNWSHAPLHADTFAQWVLDAPGDTVNLFMDFETFGEHQWEDTGIFKFLEALPEVCENLGIKFRTPSATIEKFEPRGKYSTVHWISWADESRDISAWLENDLQRSAFDELQQIEKALHAHKNSRDRVWQQLWQDFRRLTTSDHLYYMSTKYWADGDVHTYFSPYPSPYDAYINFMNTVMHLQHRIAARQNISKL